MRVGRRGEIFVFFPSYRPSGAFPDGCRAEKRVYVKSIRQEFQVSVNGKKKSSSLAPRAVTTRILSSLRAFCQKAIASESQLVSSGECLRGEDTTCQTRPCLQAYGSGDGDNA